MPQSWFHPKSPRSIFDLDGLFKEQDNAGVDITVFGNNWIRSPDGADALRVVKEFNEHAAELTAKHPKRLLGLACSVPFDDDQILKETERAIKDYKLRGIMINSSVNENISIRRVRHRFFNLLVIWMCPSSSITEFIHAMKRWRSSACRDVGRPFDTTLSLTRFIFGGLEPFPQAQLVCLRPRWGSAAILPGRYRVRFELEKTPALVLGSPT